MYFPWNSSSFSNCAPKINNQNKIQQQIWSSFLHSHFRAKSVYTLNWCYVFLADMWKYKWVKFYVDVKFLFWAIWYCEALNGVAIEQTLPKYKWSICLNGQLTIHLQHTTKHPIHIKSECIRKYTVNIDKKKSKTLALGSDTIFYFNSPSSFRL